MPNVQHALLRPGAASGIHVVHHWEVADEAARLALTVVAAQEGKVAKQVDDSSYWILARVTGGIIWTRIDTPAMVFSDELPTTIGADNSAATGDDEGAAHGDHVHAIVTGTPVPIAGAGEGADEGDGAALARANHVHPLATADRAKLDALPSTAVTVGAATPEAVGAQPGDAGSGSVAAAVNHRHQVLTSVPVAISTGSTNEAGSGDALALANHVHALDPADRAKLDGAAVASTSAPPGVGANSAIGAVTSRFAREDHTHGHGAQAGGANHAVCTTSEAGFASAADKVKIEGAVQGPAATLDNQIARYDGTTGKLLQPCGVQIDDSNNVTGVNNITMNGSITINGTVDGVDVSALAAIPFITLSAQSGLTNERYLGTAFGHSFADGGPGNPVYAAHTMLTATQTGNYTFTASDRGGMIQFNNAVTPGTFTIPSGLLAAGSEILVMQIAAQQVTIAAGAGVTLTIPPGTTAKTRGVNSVIHLRNVRGQDTWTVTGDLESSDVAGPAAATSTDNAIVRWDGATGRTVQNSGCTISDTNHLTAGSLQSNGDLTVVGNITVTGNVDGVDVGNLGAVPFVTIGNTTAVANERALQVGPGLAMADTGAGNNITLRAREGSFVWTSGGFGLNDTHEHGFVLYTGTGSVTLTIPTNAANALPVGYSARVGNFNSGRIAVSNPGVTLTWCGVYPANSSLGYGDVVRFTKTGTDSWVATWESPAPVPLGSITANLTLIAAYNKWLITAENHTADLTITIPTDAAQPTIPLGFRCEIFNNGGTSSWSVLLSTAGLTVRGVNGCSTSSINAMDKAQLTKVGANSWLIENTT